MIQGTAIEALIYDDTKAANPRLLCQRAMTPDNTQASLVAEPSASNNLIYDNGPITCHVS